MTVHRPPTADSPSAPQENQCLPSHFLASLRAQEKINCTSMLWSIDSCQNRASADQRHLTVPRAQVSTLRGRVFFEVILIFYPPINTDKPKFLAFLVFCLYDCFIYRSKVVFQKCLETRRHLASGRETVNSQGYSELREPIKTHGNCYSRIW